MNKPLTFDDVLELGLKLPRAKEDRYYGMPALKVDGEMFVVRTAHRSALPNSISVRVGFKRRQELIATQPHVFYVKPHYAGYPVVLVRLDRIDRDALQQLLHYAHRAVATGSVKPLARVRRKQGSFINR